MNKIPLEEDRTIINWIIFPIGALVTLFLAYMLDKWLFIQMRFQRSNPSSTWIQDPLFLWTVVSGLVLFAAWLGLSWIALTRSQRSLPISIIILIVGLLIYIYPFLQMIFTWLPMLFFAVRTPLSYSGLYIAILSILQLLIKQPNRTVR
jgi:hypothetical protein